MFDKKKIHFFRLASIFISLTAVVLLGLWSAPKQPEAPMMKDSMGQMMKNMHLSGITSIYDLIQRENQGNQMNMSNIQNHHQKPPQILESLGNLTTLIIFMLIPFILGGAVFLAIVWIK